jgi:signal transduction histidine kinase
VTRPFRAALKTKLVASYIVVAAFLVASLLAVSNYYLDKQFQIYVEHRQDMKNAEIVAAVTENFSGSAAAPDARFMNFLEGFGNSLAAQGVSVMAYDASGAMMYCAGENGAGCVHTRDTAGESAGDDCPEFDGAYSLKSFAINRGGQALGSVLLGYHRAFPYSGSDKSFLAAFNRVFFATAALFFALAVEIGLVMAGMIANPIKLVTERTRRIAGGDYSGEPVVTGTKETDELSSSVDQLAESLREQYALKARMAGAYSHEFRTPLAVLQSGIEAMIDGIWTPTAERLEALLSEILRMSRMVSEVDNLVRAGNPEIKLERSVRDIGEMASGVVRAYEARGVEKSVRLHFDGKSALASVDPDKFSQVIANLVSNAVKYTDPGGDISVKTDVSDGNAVLEVSDNGAGISETDVPYIFEHLYRTDESRARDSGGCGIGLSVARAVTEAHGGKITVKSKPGQGSVFTVTSPAANGAK